MKDKNPMTTQASNNKKSPTRIDIIQTVKTPLGFFTLVVLIVEGILGVITANLSQGADRTYLILGMLLLIFLLVVIVAIFALFRPEALSGKRPSSEAKAIIREIPSRPRYLDTMIDYVSRAQAAVWVCVHTLNPSRTDEKIRTLQEKLAEARTAGKDVRILAPGGVERVEAAYELNAVRKTPIKILAFLEDEDFRFTIVDDNVSIISMRAYNSDGSGSTAAIIRSERLNALLRDYFDGLWNRPESLEYDVFLSEVVDMLLDPLQPVSDIGLAQRLRVPSSEIKRIRPDAIDN